MFNYQIFEKIDEFCRFVYFRIQIDFWEISNLGLVGYFSYFADWVKYLMGIKKYKPNRFVYQEIDQDLDFDFSKDTDDENFQIKDR